MFDKYLKSILEDDQTRIYVVTAVIIYIACFTNMIPGEMKKILQSRLLKVSALAGIAYLSTKNFEGALMLTIIYFAVIACTNDKKEGFNLLKEIRNEDEEITGYSLNNMRDAISTSKIGSETAAYSSNNQGVYSEDIKTSLNNLPLAALDGERDHDGRCYVGAVKETTEAAVAVADNVGAAVFQGAANLFGGESFDPQNKVIEKYTEPTIGTGRCCNVPNSSCGLLPIDKCTIDNKGLYSNVETTMPACAAAFAKLENYTCKYKDAADKCLDAEDGSVVDDCDDPNNDKCEAPKNMEEKLLLNTNNIEFKSLNIDDITTSYLTGLDDKTSPMLNEDGQPVLIGTGDPDFHEDGSLMYIVTETKLPKLNGTKSTKKMRKLKDGYTYKYIFETPDSSTSKIKRLITNADNDSIDDINLEDAEVDEIDNNTSIYFDTGFTKVTNTDGQYLNVNQEVTDVITDAIDDTHPEFADIVEVKKPQFNKVDLFDMVYPDKSTFKKNYNLLHQTGVVNTKFIEDTNTDGTSNPNSTWSKVKSSWQKETAKNVMRSIGCHRMRNDQLDLYGYWDTSHEVPKCSYESKA
jgi:hypothetical protein